VVLIEIEINNALSATEKIISEIDKYALSDKIVLLKLKGTLLKGKTGDIRFNEIEDFVRKKRAFSLLRNTSSIKLSESDFNVETVQDESVNNIEGRILGEYSKNNPHDFNKYLPQLMGALSIEKHEDETSIIFEDRLLSELKSVLSLQGKL